LEKLLNEHKNLYTQIEELKFQNENLQKLTNQDKKLYTKQIEDLYIENNNLQKLVKNNEKANSIIDNLIKEKSSLKNEKKELTEKLINKEIFLKETICIIQNDAFEIIRRKKKNDIQKVNFFEIVKEKIYKEYGINNHHLSIINYPKTRHYNIEKADYFEICPLSRSEKEYLKKQNQNVYVDLQSLNNKKLKKNINMIVSHCGETRVFTKRMLLDIINDIYNSKKYFDLCCIENKMPNETMEQHLYSYLNHKYGLKVNSKIFTSFQLIESNY